MFYALILAFGSWAISCLLTHLLFMKLWNVDRLFRTVVPIGSIGGHGTAAGMQITYQTLDCSTGADLAFTSATIGIMTVVMNIANVYGWTHKSYQENSLMHANDNYS